MPPSEKRKPPATLVETSIPTDLPPSYEHTILPNSNPWTDTPAQSQSQPSLPTQAQAQAPPSIPSQNPLSALSRLTTIPFSKYRVRDSKLSDDQTTLTSTNPELISSSGSASNSVTIQRNLFKFINEQAALPPKPIMIIRGSHLGSGALHGQQVVDFELKCNLTSLLDLNPSNEGTGSSQGGGGDGIGGGIGQSTGSTLKIKRYQHGLSNGSPKQLSKEEKDMSPLELWVKKFCEDKAENRSFALSRTCPNLPTSFLEGLVRTLLASAKYQGKLTVEFPVHHSSVTIPRKSSNWFTNLLRLYPTKKYEVVSAEWTVVGTSQRERERDREREGEEAQGQNPARPSMQRTATSHTMGEGMRSSADSTSSTTLPANDDTSGDHTGLPTLVAQAWWREWHFAIWNAVLGGKKGWVTVEDWIEAKMGVREKERVKEWGVDYE